jgi:D-glycero-alpha-D-manno-heptose 1-phosphate guanylyltransferase
MLNQHDLILLTGGLGTRLREVIGENQKVIANVDGVPFLLLLLQYVYKQGFRRVVLALGYHADHVIQIIEHSNLPKDLEVIFSVETARLGTAGAIRLASQYIKSKTVFIQNGDSFCDIDYQKMLEHHNAKDADVTVAVSQANDRKDVGMIQLDQFSNIISFSEKDNLIDGLYESSGIYIMNQSAINVIPLNEEFSIEEDFFAKKVFKKFIGYVSMSKALDIGTKERFTQAQTALSLT